jgi:hypothetical protein
VVKDCCNHSVAIHTDVQQFLEALLWTAENCHLSALVRCDCMVAQQWAGLKDLHCAGECHAGMVLLQRVDYYVLTTGATALWMASVVRQGDQGTEIVDAIEKRGSSLEPQGPDRGKDCGRRSRQLAGLCCVKQLNLRLF